jgi:hypothetical protein
MLSVMLACGLALCFIIPASAHEKFLVKVRRDYKLDRSNGKCALCHEERKNEDPSRKNINVFGKAIQADPAMKPLLDKDEKHAWTDKDMGIIKDVVAKLESADTDGDGATNREELDLGTYPGDSKSTPDKAALEKYRKEAAAKK